MTSRPMAVYRAVPVPAPIAAPAPLRTAQAAPIRQAPPIPQAVPIRQPAPPVPIPRAVPVRPPAPQPVPHSPRSPRRPRFRPAQAVCWQVAVALVAVTLGRERWLLGAAYAVALALVAGTATHHRGLWTYQWCGLGIAYRVRPSRFRPLNARLGRLVLGEDEAATLSHQRGVTALFRVAGTANQPVPAELPMPGDLLDEQHGLAVQTLLHRGGSWLALTAPRTTAMSEDAELTVLLGNAARRMRRPLARLGVAVTPLPAGAACTTWESMAPPVGDEEWSALRLGAGRYRMYAVPADMAVACAGRPGVVTVALSNRRPDALVLLDARQWAPPLWELLSGRQRAAFRSALPGSP